VLQMVAVQIYVYETRRGIPKRAIKDMQRKGEGRGREKGSPRPESERLRFPLLPRSIVPNYSPLCRDSIVRASLNLRVLIPVSENTFYYILF
jgi:hypothetical protein